MKLTVVIPCFNEAATIADVIRKIPRNIDHVSTLRIVVVDDGSSDQTAEIAEASGAIVVSHQVNRGVGAAFATGIDSALSHGADIIVNMDGDGQFNPADIPELIVPIVAGNADFVTCTRFGKKEFEPVMPTIKRRGNAFMCWLINAIISEGPFTDVSCGFRAYSRQTALKLNLHGDFTYTQESFIDLAGKNTRMVEVPLKVRGVREFGQSRVASNLWRYGTRSSMIILRALRDTKPLSVFGSLACILFFLGLLLGAAVVVWWAVTGRTHPFRSVLYGSSTALIMAFVIGVMSLLADMTGRLRKTQEKILTYMKEQHYHRKSQFHDEE